MSHAKFLAPLILAALFLAGCIVVPLGGGYRHGGGGHGSGHHGHYRR